MVHTCAQCSFWVTPSTKTFALRSLAATLFSDYTQNHTTTPQVPCEESGLFLKKKKQCGRWAFYFAEGGA